MELYWYSRNRRKVLETGVKLGAGQEGTVYALPAEPGTVVKVYDDSSLSAEEAKRKAEERAKKLKLFVAHPPHNPPDPDDGHQRFAWPQKVLFNGAGQCVGYAMPRVPCGQPLDTFIYPKDGVLPERKLRVALAREVASIVAEMHQHELRVVLGDISPANFLADAKGRVALIDIDSAQIESPSDGKIYHCPTRTSEYTPPELIGRDLGTMLRTKEHDLFGLSVLGSQFLFDGWPPYAARDGRSVESRILAGDCPLIRGGAGRPPEAPPFGGGPDFDVGAELRALLVKAFVAGHANPRMRPTAGEWEDALLYYEKVLGRPVPSVPSAAQQVTRAAPPWPWRRRAVVAFGGVAAVAASVGFISVGAPLIGGVNVRKSLASVLARVNVKVNVKSVERRREIVTNDDGELPRGPQPINETPHYWQLIRDGKHRSLSFEP